MLNNGERGMLRAERIDNNNDGVENYTMQVHMCISCSHHMCIGLVAAKLWQLNKMTC